MSLFLSNTDHNGEGKVHGKLNEKLRPYQRDGVQFLWDRIGRGAGGILCDDMGLGKTVQVIALLSALYGKSGDGRDKREIIEMKIGDKKVNPSLIICPGSVLCNWEDELGRWGQFCHLRYHRNTRDSTLTQALNGRVEIVLTTYDTVREYSSSLNRVDWKVTVADECHKIKESKSGVTIALKSLSCTSRIGLTGTALQNKYEELWCLLDWANPGCLGSLDHFRSEFSLPMVRGFRQDASKEELATARLKQTKFNALKQTWLIRRTKNGVIADQLPQKTDQVLFCGLSSFQQEVFKFLLDHPKTKQMLASFDPCYCGKRRPSYLCCRKQLANDVKPQAILLQFMQIFLKVSNHAALILPESTNSSIQAQLGEEICSAVMSKFPDLKERNFLNLSNPRFSGKMEVLDSLLAILENEKAKVLLFSYSTKLLNIIETYIQSKGFSYCRLDGSTKVDVRQELVNDFNKDKTMFLFLISTKAGGLGLNITGANTVIIFDPNWNPAHDQQAQDRAYRIGQQRDVRVFRLVSAGCIEEVIYLRQVYKQQLASASIDGCSAKRFFRAVQGDKKRKGELFGIKNLLRVTTNQNRSCLTEDIEKRNDEMEKKIRNKSKVSLTVADYDLDDSESFQCPDVTDPFNIGLEEELSGNIVYSHFNNKVVGGSREEEQISREASKGTKRGQGSEPAHDCEQINSQNLEDEGENGQFDLDKYNPGTAGDLIRTVHFKHRSVRFGDTPLNDRLQQFESLAAQNGVDKYDFAQKVLTMSWSEKLDVLKRNYSNDEPITVLLNKISQEHCDQEREVKVRSMTYNNLSNPGIQPSRSKSKKQKKFHKTSSHFNKHNSKKPAIDTDIKDKDDDQFSDDDDDLLTNLNRSPANSKKIVTDGVDQDEDESDEQLPDDGDDDLLLASAYTSIDSKSDKESKTEVDKQVDVTAIIRGDTLSSNVFERKQIKAAPVGQFYKKRIDCDKVDCDNKSDFRSVSFRSDIVTSKSNPKDCTIDDIFDCNNDISSTSNARTVLSSNSKSFKCNTVVNTSIDDIFD